MMCLCDFLKLEKEEELDGCRCVPDSTSGTT